MFGADDNEIGSLFVSVVPSLAGLAGHMRDAGGQAAETFAGVFKNHPAMSGLFTAEHSAAIATKMGEAGNAGGKQFADNVKPHIDQVNQTMGSSVVAAGAVGGAFALMGELAAQGVEAIADSAVELVKAVSDVGEEWENVSRILTVNTTAMAGDLDTLNDTVKSVAANTSASLGDIATATASLAQRTGLRGGALQDLVTDFADAQRILGKPVDTAKFTASMHALGVPMTDADKWLTQLFNIARETGVPLTQLVDSVSKNGAALREFGAAAGPAAALLAQLQANGIDTSAATRGLSAAFKEAAKEGKDLPDFLRDSVAQLQHFHDVGDQVSELKVAERVFGPRGALPFTAAIDQGILSVQSLAAAFDIPADKISDLYNRTKTLSDEWAEFHSRMDIAFGPIGRALNEQFGAGLHSISDWVATHGDELVGWFKAVADAILNCAEFGAEFLELFGVNTDSFRAHLQDIKKGFDESADAVRANTKVIDDLNGVIDKTKDNKLELKTNTPEVVRQLDDLKKMGIEISKGKDGELVFTADTPDNQKRVKDFLKNLTGKDADVKVVPKPKTPDGHDYGGDPHSLFPGSDKNLDITITPHVDDKFIPGWLKKLWGVATMGPQGLSHLFGDDPADRLPSIHDDQPTGPPQTPDAKPDHDREAKQDATKGYAAQHGDRMPPGTAQWLDGKGPMPPDLAPYFHPQGHQGGGMVFGNYSPGFDTVPAMLQPGEFVLPRWMTPIFGPTLEAVRRRGFDTGGPVDGDVPALPIPAAPTSPFSLPGLPTSPWASKPTRETEAWQDKQREAARTVEHAKDRIQDLQNNIQDYQDTLKSLTDKMNDPGADPTQTAEYTKQYNRAQQQLTRATRDLAEAQDDLKQDERKQVEAAQTPPSTAGGKGGGGEDIGSGIVKGILSEIGFGSIFGAAPTQFGIFKLAEGIIGALFGPTIAKIFGPVMGVPVPVMPGGYQVPTASSVPTYPPPQGPTGNIFNQPTYGPAPGPVAGAPAAPAAPSTPAPITAPWYSSPHAATSGYVPASGDKSAVAQGIYSAVTGAGYSPQTGLAAVADASYESGLNPDRWETGGSDHYGLFQESGDKPRSGFAQQVGWLVNTLNALGGPAVVDRDPTNIIADRVEVGGYSGSKYDLGAAAQLLGGAASGPVSPFRSAAYTTAATTASGGGDYGASAGKPTIGPPNENSLRSWVQQNFGIPNTFGTGSWENAAHDADGGWHHNLTHDKSVPGYAFDFHGTPEQMDRLANWIADNDLKNTLELIHQGPGFDHNREIKNAKFGDVYGPALDAAHADHVHWALTAPPDGDVAPDTGGGSPYSGSYPTTTTAGYSGGYSGGGLGVMADVSSLYKSLPGFKSWMQSRGEWPGQPNYHNPLAPAAPPPAPAPAPPSNIAAQPTGTRYTPADQGQGHVTGGGAPAVSIDMRSTTFWDNSHQNSVTDKVLTSASRVTGGGYGTPGASHGGLVTRGT